MATTRNIDAIGESLNRLKAVFESAEAQLKDIGCPFDVSVDLNSEVFPEGSLLWWTKRAGQWRICVQYPDRDDCNSTEFVDSVRVSHRLEAVKFFRQLRAAVIKKKADSVAIIDSAADELESILQENEL